MKNTIMPTNERRCPHCGEKGSLRYYKEAEVNADLYYCEKCYGLVEWYGLKTLAVPGEAYPDRDKK
jgi:uncharacterized protein with PIN domain